MDNKYFQEEKDTRVVRSHKKWAQEVRDQLCSLSVTLPKSLHSHLSTGAEQEEEKDLQTSNLQRGKERSTQNSVEMSKT